MSLRIPSFLTNSFNLKKTMPTKTSTKLSVVPIAKIAKQKKASLIVKKKSTLKKNKLRPLVWAQEGTCFWTNDGRILANLVELNKALGAMTNEVYIHHVTHDKNDFADWVESILCDAECAEGIRKAKGPSATKKIIGAQLKRYSK